VRSEPSGPTGAAATPKRRAGRRTPLLLLAPATFFEGYDLFVLALALPLIRRDFGLSLGEAGVVASVAFAGSFGVLVLLPLADRLGRRPVLAFTIAGYTVATFATALVPGVVGFTICQFAARLFLGAEYALATIVVVETTEPGRRGRALGLLTSMAALGQAAAGGGFLLVLALDASWRWLYAAGVLPLVLVARARRDLPETAPPRRRPPGPRERALRSVPAPWLAGAGAVAFLFAVYPTAVTTLASTLVLEDWKWKLSELRPWEFALWAAGLSGFLVGGRLLDRVGRRPTTIAFLLAAAAAGAFAFTAGTTVSRAVGLGLVIFALTGATPCVAAYATELFPLRTRGRINAWLKALTIAGQVTAPAIATALAGPLGGVGPALAVVGGTYAIAALVVWTVLPETRGLHQEDVRGILEE
jgi:MFS family permease